MSTLIKLYKFSTLRYNSPKISTTNKDKNMQASINLIKEFVTPVTVATYCPIQDTYYIGYNQTLNVYNGLSWTEAQVEADLKQQVNLIHMLLDAYFIGVIEDNHKVALISLIHDIGPEIFMKSELPRHLRNRNYILASNAFLNFNKVARVISITKTARRLKEQNIFNTK